MNDARAERVPLASVIILNHNGARIMDVLRRALHAAADQDYPCVQLIAVDDNSSDGSDVELRDVCRELGAEFTSTCGGRHGICAARNRGLDLARGDYIAFLDNDAVPEQGWLTALVRFMEAHPQMGACASRVMFADRGDIVNSMGSTLNELFHGNGVCIHELCEFARPPSEVMYATGNGMMLRRAALDRVGRFDEGYLFWGADDADLGMRLRRAGWRIAPVPDAAVLHLHSFSKTQQGMPFWDGRNRVRLALKHLAWYELPAFLARDIPFNAHFGTLRDYARCWWSTLADVDGLRALWRYRLVHSGEPGYKAAFAEWLRPTARLIVAPDNRPYGREMTPLRELVMGEKDEPHLYHGWYWPERYGSGWLRWARRVASLVGSLREGAKALRLAVLTPPMHPHVGLTLRIRRREPDAPRAEEVAAYTEAFDASGAGAPLLWTVPCDLPPGDYHLILEADAEPLERGVFPRQVSFGLAGLSVEPGRRT